MEIELSSENPLINLKRIYEKSNKKTQRSLETSYGFPDYCAVNAFEASGQENGGLTGLDVVFENKSD